MYSENDFQVMNLITITGILYYSLKNQRKREDKTPNLLSLGLESLFAISLDGEGFVHHIVYPCSLKSNPCNPANPTHPSIRISFPHFPTPNHQPSTSHKYSPVASHPRYHNNPDSHHDHLHKRVGHRRAEHMIVVVVSNCSFGPEVGCMCFGVGSMPWVDCWN